MKYIHVEAFESTAEKRVLWPNHVSPFLLALFFAKCAKAAISRALSEKKRKEKGGGGVPPKKRRMIILNIPKTQIKNGDSDAIQEYD